MGVEDFGRRIIMSNDQGRDGAEGGRRIQIEDNQGERSSGGARIRGSEDQGERLMVNQFGKH